MFASTRSAVWQHLLPSHSYHPEPSIPPVRVTQVVFRIRYLIEELINIEVKVYYAPAIFVRNEVILEIGKLVDSATFSNYH
jgi:hypothetical protein